MIRNLGVSVYEDEYDSQSFTCDECGVLIGTCMDFGYNDDYAVREWNVEESIMICGKCKKK